MPDVSRDTVAEIVSELDAVRRDLSVARDRTELQKATWASNSRGGHS